MTNWATWQPRVRATLLFIVREGKDSPHPQEARFRRGQDQRTRRQGGFGRNPFSRPCAKRSRSSGSSRSGPKQRGELHFQFRDGYSLHCTVFLAHDFEGEPRETDEASPLWTPLDAIPYDKMWADDRYWLPLLIRGARLPVFSNSTANNCFTARSSFGSQLGADLRLVEPERGAADYSGIVT